MKTRILIALILGITILFTVLLQPVSKAYANTTYEWKDATEVVRDMQIGWNLGNTLDAYSTNYKAYEERRTSFKLVAFYSASPYDVWNHSKEIQFGKDGKLTIAWDMSEIKSSKTSKLGSFGFQIWNFDTSETLNLDLNVTKAEFVSGNGTIYTLSDLLGKRSVTMKNSVASVSLKDMAGITDTSEIMKGKLKLTVSIENISDFIENSSKEYFYETFWYNDTLTTKAMIEEIRKQGFGAVRVPVTYYNFTDPDTYEIDDVRLDRVEEVVNYVLDSGMYCIINIHHDTGTNGWLKASNKNLTKNKDRFTRLWEQISEKYKDYGDHLLFEGFNEIIDEDNNWSIMSTEAIDVVNQLNQIFVDTVRKSGGNNGKRVLVTNTYAASSSEAAIRDFKVPADSIQNKIIVQVHDYSPIEFAWYKDDQPQRTTWGTDEDKRQIDSIMTRLNTHFVSKGIPVIIGEFGSCNKKNTSERAEHASYLVSAAKKYNITCFWWDDGINSLEGKSHGIFLRPKNTWAFPEIADALVKAAGSEKREMYDISKATVAKISKQTYTGKKLTPEVKVTYKEKTLKKGIDYSVTYNNNQMVGQAEITIIGKGDYTGSLKVKFQIVPGKPTVKLKSTKSKTITVTTKKVTGASGYQIAYCKTKTGTYTKAVRTGELTKSIQVLSQGSYYVKVRAYKTVDGVRIYGSYSSPMKVKVK